MDDGYEIHVHRGAVQVDPNWLLHTTQEMLRAHRDEWQALSDAMVSRDSLTDLLEISSFIVLLERAEKALQKVRIDIYAEQVGGADFMRLFGDVVDIGPIDDGGP